MQNLESLAEKLREGFVSDDVKLATDGIHRILVGYQMATIRRLDAAYAEVQNNGLKRTRDHTSPEQAWDCKTQVEVENSRHELTRDFAQLEKRLLTKKKSLSQLPAPLTWKEPDDSGVVIDPDHLECFKSKLCYLCNPGKYYDYDTRIMYTKEEFFNRCVDKVKVIQYFDKVKKKMKPFTYESARL
jgi:hypothetical protein